MKSSQQPDLLDMQLYVNLRGNFSAGWYIAQLLEKERPYCNRCAFNRGWHYLHQGYFKEGFQLLDRGRFENIFGSPPLQTNKPIWNTEDDLDKKYVVIRAEGGIGDEIINARFIKDFADKGAKVIIGAHPSLTSVISRIEGVSGVVTSGNEQHIYHDYWIPSMSTPWLSGNTYETLSGKPYLTNIKPKANLPGEFKIGIRWKGNPDFEHEQHRNFPPELLFEIANKHKDVSVYSLQKDSKIDELPYGIINLDNFMIDWESTIQFIDDMDLIISSCTAVAHIAAALGKETWIITPILPYYIWALPGNKSPWYDSVTLYRQVKYGSWEETFEKLYHDLEKRIKG